MPLAMFGIAITWNGNFKMDVVIIFLYSFQIIFQSGEKEGIWED